MKKENIEEQPPRYITLNSMNQEWVKARMGSPEHYKPATEGAPEPWDVFHELHMPYALAAALKYVLRHERKGNPEQDWEKALRCLEKAATLKTPFPMRHINSPCREKTIFWPMVHGQGDARFLKRGHPLSQFMAAMEIAAVNYFYGQQLEYEKQVMFALAFLNEYITSRKALAHGVGE